ncbi:sensor histidine kinase [Geotalea toluenoxydans]|uniref:sensor histidine kinase n=1 Tax=Geotalea toluenoxydans TaxID=421624 RepID=UPI0006D194CD|nr:ATP-binding protein [Geotalea toluenoxydans]
MRPSQEGISYVVGDEKRLHDVLIDTEVIPLLEGAVQAGADNVTILDPDGIEIWSATQRPFLAEPLVVFSLKLEGEPVGTINVFGDQDSKPLLFAVGKLLAVALNAVISNNLKRILTTEIHTTVVNTSFEQLVEINQQLSQSEARYRDLAESLEKRVNERTFELKKAHSHLLQQEKMAAIGQLAAGIAHEINNPLGFITSNLHTLQKYVNRLSAMLFFFKDLNKIGSTTTTLIEQAEQKWQELKIDTVCTDVGDLLSQTLTGAERVTNIVADLKGFSHVDEVGLIDIDVNREIELTLSVLCHQLKNKVEIVRDLQPLPVIKAQAAVLSQVFLNIIQNAIQSRGDGLRVTLATAWDGKRIRISIADNGPGILPEHRGRVFEPFFTTREVGAGKGMGLAVVYDSVLKLGGTVSVADAADGGADFIITIPQGKE